MSEKSKENIDHIKNQLDVNLQKIIKNRSVSNFQKKNEKIFKDYAPLETVERLTFKILKKLIIIINKVFIYIYFSLAVLSVPLLLLKCFILAIIPYMGGNQSCFNIFK